MRVLDEDCTQHLLGPDIGGLWGGNSSRVHGLSPGKAERGLRHLLKSQQGIAQVCMSIRYLEAWYQKDRGMGNGIMWWTQGAALVKHFTGSIHA